MGGSPDHNISIIHQYSPLYILRGKIIASIWGKYPYVQGRSSVRMKGGPSNTKLVPGLFGPSNQNFLALLLNIYRGAHNEICNLKTENQTQSSNKIMHIQN